MAIADVSKKPIADLTSLQGRTAVITGGSKGIGRGIATRFAEAGAKVMVASRHEDEATQAAEEIAEQTGREVIGQVVDVTQPDTVQALADDAQKRWGRLDIWVNNAGAETDLYGVLELSRDDWNQIVNVSLGGAFHGTQEAAKRMANGEGGVIINVVSTAAFSPETGQAAYSATKRGVVALGKSFAKELADKNVRVLSIAPTFIKTPGTDALMETWQKNTGMDESAITERLPLGRIGVPDDVARVALFAASDLALFMTGSTLFVDAGQLAG